MSQDGDQPDCDVRKLIWLILVGAVGAGSWFAWAVLTPIEPSSQTFVLLRPGYTTRRIATELKSAGVIRSEEAFMLWHYFHRGRSLKAGEYVFDKPANIIGIQKRLRRGDVYFHTVVVPEGFTMFDIARAIEAAGLGPADDFVKAAQSDTALITDIAPGAHSLEGYLFPETYEFTRMMTMHDMAAAMVKQFRQVARQDGLAPERRQRAARRMTEPRVTPRPECSRAAVTMASIVEKETAVPEERPLVASVYYNRLDEAHRAGCRPEHHLCGAARREPIRARCITPTCRSVRRITPTAMPGFRQGPIGNPGRSALEAAMHPAQS